MPLGATAANVNALNGGAFSQSQVDVAAGLLEGYLGWHVAPEVSGTVQVYNSGSPTLVLPTLTVSEVTSVTALRDDQVVSENSYYLAGGPDDLQLLEQRYGCWCRGWYAVELTHGYATPPKDLLAALEALCKLAGLDVTVESESIADYAVKYRNRPEEVAAISGAVSRYGLPKAG